MKNTQHTRCLFLIMAFCLCLWSPIKGETQQIQHHYYDLHQNSLEQYDHIWETLHKYYGEHLPDVLEVEYLEGNGSWFSTRNDRIRLSVNRLYQSTGGVRLIAHESSHIGLYHLTSGASILEQFRFFDEGLANIMGAIATDALPKYKRLALNVAALQQEKENVSLEKVQKWSSYYGKPGSGTPYAYDVGASFDFFLLDAYGQDRLFQFLKDIGKTRDLDTTSRNVFNLSAQELETAWLQYLAEVEINPSLQQPMVVEMFPGHNAQNVPVNLEEIYLRFNTEMMTKGVCIGTPCRDTGVCYKDAYWKTKNTLAIKVKDGLKPDSTYHLSLGVAGKCGFKSAEGIDLPVTPWVFSTEKK